MSQRINELINIISKEERYFNYDELSILLKISPKLVRQTCDFLVNELSRIGVNPISKKYGKGIIMKVSENERQIIDEFIMINQESYYISKNDREIIMILDIAEEKNKINSKNYQEKFKISKSSVDDDMRNIRELCSKFSINILSCRKAGLYFEGDEMNIRLLINNLIIGSVECKRLIVGDFKACSMENIISDYIEKQKILDNYSYLSSSLELYLDNDIYLVQLTIMFTLWQKRFLNNQKIDKDDTELRMDTSRYHSMHIVEGFIRFNNLLNVDNNEKIYLEKLIDSLIQGRSLKFDNLWTESHILSLKMIQELSTNRLYRYELDEKLFPTLMQHVSGMLKRIDEGIVIYNPMNDFIFSEYLELSENIKDMTMKFGLELADEEISYLCLHFGASEKRLERNNKIKYKVIIVCSHGIATGNIIAEKLKDKYLFDIVAVLSSFDISLIRKIKVDFILTTTDISIVDVPVIKISPTINEEDYNKITRLIEEKINIPIYDRNSEENSLIDDIVYLAKNNCISLFEESFRKELEILLQNKIEKRVKEKRNQPMIKEILEDDLINLGLEATDWKDSIRKASKCLVEKKYIEEEYVDSMIKTVVDYGPYIVLARHMALAHAKSSDDVNKLSLSVATFKTPVVFNHTDNDPVKLMFCLGAVDDRSHLKIMAGLVRLINNESKIEQLCNITNKEDFKNILFQVEEGNDEN